MHVILHKLILTSLQSTGYLFAVVCYDRVADKQPQSVCNTPCHHWVADLVLNSKQSNSSIAESCS